MQVSFEERAEKEFLKLSKSIQIQILKYLKKVEALENPKDMGKPLRGNLKDYWRYRVGDYRLICKIREQELLVVVVALNHRSKVYK
ncbi:type II toxin-antitoxin system RelE/ParE family toxin [Helicobacter sp. MIT 00-7814]|uniref:type II toxin-antitoxin system RelE family toxin n=1 Tax=unclassified Helicobacter TaxID=2593540 RepID=UPI000E1FA248|nr:MULTISPECIES: type II toxin-antitoxin system RelE/ParE family toxin [unclassified Helicobacter]RDU52806.1 type II toxin-antitoxin system RelE/ParE family toxin [Helicobacter sp. MIT 99-10781]RDU53257.1 type II toxin-antitoxin system RelE/ParE family toxin [Helicobacter sp. MIT 00-7814]